MKEIGILTAGGDSPGLNAAIRAVGKVLCPAGYRLTGFMDGFAGLALDRTMDLDGDSCEDVLNVGGTILRTSRARPDRVTVDGVDRDMTEEIVENYRKHDLACLVCIGGGGTLESALALQQEGLRILFIPKTIDNDIAGTETSIGFDSALGVATRAIDSLRATAGSHKRIMLVEVMGHHTGWLTLGSGLAGGADVILIPELPFTLEKVAETLRRRAAQGREFSIMPVAEGAMTAEDHRRCEELRTLRGKASDAEARARLKHELKRFQPGDPARIFGLAEQLEKLTGLETRVTVLGHLQRGGAPSATDRLLATRLGTACAELALKKRFGRMCAVRAGAIVDIPLTEAAGARKPVTADHPWMRAARELWISFGDE